VVRCVGEILYKSLSFGHSQSIYTLTKVEAPFTLINTWYILTQLCTVPKHTEESSRSSARQVPASVQQLGECELHFTTSALGVVSAKHKMQAPAAFSQHYLSRAAALRCSLAHSLPISHSIFYEEAKPHRSSLLNQQKLVLPPDLLASH